MAPSAQEHAPGLCTVHATLALAPGVSLPLTCTAIRLADGGVWVHSPIDFDAASVAALDALGPVRFVVAPSGLHHLFARAALARWPAAQLVASPAVAPKQPGLAFTPLRADAPPWGDEIAALPIGGMPGVEEWVFFHRPTGTLLVTDLLFHLTDVSGWVNHLVFAAMGTRGRLAVSRLYRSFIRDRDAVAASVERLLAWPISRIIPCHGAVLAADAHARAAAALAPLRSVRARAG